jgi:hypothetical protein
MNPFKLSLLFLFILQLPLFSQDTKGRFVIEEDGNYWHTSNANLRNGQLNIASNIGYVPCENTIVGIGVNLQNEREQYILNNTVSSEIRKHGFAPLVFAKKIIPLRSKFSAALKMQCSYGWTKDEINTYRENPYYSSYGTGNNYGYDYSGSMIAPKSPLQRKFSLLLSPEFQFHISSRLGALVNLNGLEYYDRHYEDESRGIKQHTSDFSLSFKPSQWRLGIFFLLGK